LIDEDAPSAITYLNPHVGLQTENDLCVVWVNHLPWYRFVADSAFRSARGGGQPGPMEASDEARADLDAEGVVSGLEGGVIP
jgi:hypothetical protein